MRSAAGISHPIASSLLLSLPPRAWGPYTLLAHLGTTTWALGEGSVGLEWATTALCLVLCPPLQRWAVAPSGWDWQVAFLATLSPALLLLHRRSRQVNAQRL